MTVTSVNRYTPSPTTLLYTHVYTNLTGVFTLHILVYQQNSPCLPVVSLKCGVYCTCIPSISLDTRRNRMKGIFNFFKCRISTVYPK